MLFCFFFFFSSRRRHTRCSRDWSSDVCSSDLIRDRVGRLINFRHARYVRLRGVDRAKTGLKPLVIAYDALDGHRSEEHTSELQSRLHLVCRLLLEKKKKKKKKIDRRTYIHT